MRGSRRYLPVAVGGFTPLQVAGCVLWLAADRSALYQDAAGTIPALLDGDPVGLWKDLSGLGYDMSQATAAAKGTLKQSVIHGRPTIRFDGVDDFLTNSGVPRPASFSVFCVFQMPDLSVRRGVAGSIASNGASASGWGNVYVGLESTGNLDSSTGDGTNYTDTYTTTQQVTINTPGLASVVFTSGAPPIQIWFNGNAPTVTTLGTATTNSGVASPYSVGRLGAYSGDYFNGDIAELVIYSAALSTADRQRVERYLEAKYGLAVV